MKPKKIVGYILKQVNHESQIDDYSQKVLDHFADEVDNEIHSKLISELIGRYTAVSKKLEDTNRALAMSDASRREAQRIAQLGNWDVDIQTHRLWWSDTMYEILELDPPSAEPSLEVYYQLAHPDDCGELQKVVASILSGIVPDDLNYRLKLKSGKIKWVQTRQIPIRDAEGKLISVHGTIQDITAQKLTEEKLEKLNTLLEGMVQEKVREISSSQMATIYALVKLAESRDDETGDHIARTSEYCRLIARAALDAGYYTDEIDDAFIENIANASPLHDIGKVGIPDAILLKPGRLTMEEFEIMKTHVTLGAETLAMVNQQYPENAFIRVGMDIARYHHEKWDGSGYIEHLKGEGIPLAARIMALADVYDALRSKRVYKDAFPHEKAMAIIHQGSGNHFDPRLVEVVERNQPAMRAIFDGSMAARTAEIDPSGWCVQS